MRVFVLTLWVLYLRAVISLRGYVDVCSNSLGSLCGLLSFVFGSWVLVLKEFLDSTRSTEIYVKYLK